MRKAYEKRICQRDNRLANSILYKSIHSSPSTSDRKPATLLPFLKIANSYDMALLQSIGRNLSGLDSSTMNLLRQLFELPEYKNSSFWLSSFRAGLQNNNTYSDGMSLSVLPGKRSTSDRSIISRLLSTVDNQIIVQNSLSFLFSTHPTILDNPPEQLINNVIYLDRFTEYQTYFTKNKLDELFTQRDVEVELLKRALAVAKGRLSATKIKLYKSILQSKKLQKRRQELKTELLQLKQDSENFRAKNATRYKRLSRERIDLESSLEKLQQQLYEDKSVEQRQITALQESLTEMQSQLTEVNGSAEKNVEVLNDEIDQMHLHKKSLELQLEQNSRLLTEREDDNKKQIDELESKYRQREKRLKNDLDDTNSSLVDQLNESETEVATLKKQLDDKELSRQQLQREKVSLAESLKDETTHNLKLVEQASALNDCIQCLQQEIKSKQQANRDLERAQSKATAASKLGLEKAKNKIDELKSTRKQLEETLEQQQTEAKQVQEQMDHALAKEKRHSQEQNAHHEETITELKLQLEASCTEGKQKLLEARQQAEEEIRSLLEKSNQSIVTEKQNADVEQARLKSIIEELDQQLAANRSKSEKELEEARRQARAGSHMLLGRMNQALSAEKQQAREEQRRLGVVIEELNYQLQATRAEADHKLDKLQRQSQANIRTQQEQMDQAMKLALADKQQQTTEELTRLESELIAVKQELADEKAEFAHQLEEIQAQAQLDTQLLQKQMDREKKAALERQQQQAGELQDRLEKEVKELKLELQETQVKSDRQLDDAQRTAQHNLQQQREEMTRAMDQAEKAWQQRAMEEKNRLESEIEQLKEERQSIKYTADQQLEDALEQAEQEFILQKEQMKQSFESERQTLNSELILVRSINDGLKKEMQETQSKTERKLEEVNQQAQDEARLLQEQMNQATEQAVSVEKAQAMEVQNKLEDEIDVLNKKLFEIEAEQAVQLEEVRKQVRTSSQMVLGRMSQSMEAEKQRAKHKQIQLKSEIDSLHRQSQIIRHEAEQQLNEVKQQAEEDYNELQKQMEQALESEKQQAIEVKARLEAESERLNEQLRAVRNEAQEQRDKRLEQEALFEQERLNSNQLKELLKETEDRMAVAAETYQKKLADLHGELASDPQITDTEELLKDYQKLASQNEELKKEITRLHAQLEHQQQSNGVVLTRYENEKAELQQNLSIVQGEVKMAKTTIRLMKKNQDTLGATVAKLEQQLSEQRSEAKAKQAQLADSIESIQQENGSLRYQLKTVTSQNRDHDALQQVKQENRLLKQKIKGIREVQLEMESQLVMDGDDEIKALHEELKTTQCKLKKAEKLAHQSELLLRENQIHESAIEILSEDLDAIALEKETLTEECDYLRKELYEIKGSHLPTRP